MKALSYRNPWPWGLLYGGKDLENRRRKMPLRGRMLIHASQGCTLNEYFEARLFMRDAGADIEALPPLEKLPKGGIVGVLTFTGEVVTANDLRLFLRETPNEPWLMDGQYGYRVRDAKPLPFLPFKGMLGVFDVPDDVLAKAYGDDWRAIVGLECST